MKKERREWRRRIKKSIFTLLFLMGIAGCSKQNQVEKNKVKKNQLMITALALMIAVAGYLHFSGDVSDQITISEGAAEEQTENTASEAATMIEYTVEDTYTAEELAQMGLNDDMSATDDGMAMFDISDEDMLTDIESLDSELADTDDGYEDELSSIDFILITFILCSFNSNNTPTAPIIFSFTFAFPAPSAVTTTPVTSGNFLCTT